LVASVIEQAMVKLRSGSSVVSTSVVRLIVPAPLVNRRPPLATAEPPPRTMVMPEGL